MKQNGIGRNAFVQWLLRQNAFEVAFAEGGSFYPFLNILLAPFRLSTKWSILVHVKEISIAASWKKGSKN